MKQQKNTPNNNYGKVYFNIITDKNLTKIARAVYSLLAVKQGGSDAAHLTQTQIADSLKVTQRTVGTAFSDLQKAGIIKPANKTGGSWQVIQPELTNQYGKVEQIVLGSNLISVNAKLLYSYYVVVTGGVETCTRSADTIKQDLKIGNDKYHAAFKELQESTLITVTKRNVKTGYVNLVVPRRLKKANPKNYLPESWFTDEPEPLNLPEISFADVAAKLGSPDRKKQVALIGKSREMNINHNTNLNIKQGVPYTTFQPLVKEIAPTPDLFSVIAKDFDFKTATGNNELIIGLFEAIRTATGNADWRLSTKDYSLCQSCINLRDFDKTEIEDFKSFLTVTLIPQRGTKDSFSYYVSDGILNWYLSNRN